MTAKEPAFGDNPEAVVAHVRSLADDELHNLAEVVRQVQIERAIDSGDHDAIIAAGFESGFGATASVCCRGSRAA